MGFGPQEWDLGLTNGMWALRTGCWPREWDVGLKNGMWVSRMESGS